MKIKLYTDDSGANVAHEVEGHKSADFCDPCKVGDHFFASETAEMLRATLHDCDLRDILAAAARGEFTCEVYLEGGKRCIDWMGEDSDGEEFMMRAVLS